jgi:hypothetical protein
VLIFNGIRVFVSPDVPKMQLSKDCPVTDDYRADTNAWMIRFFGTTNLLKDGEFYRIYEGTVDDQIICNPRTYAKLQEALKK